MNTTSKIALGTSIGLILGVLAVPVVYKSVGITTEAHTRVVEYATAHNMSYRDAVSEIVVKCTSIPPFTGYIRPANYESLSLEKKLEVVEGERDSALRWISGINR